eukprot:gnl/TRDRNA2_/TRDRNA2_187809_c0_seq1.p1 gnl/TRDRNA2_/TRDRNA2_187809_c0~~gnl/TRDRNA2_/TRDRNA2_187809_c0_seq1.p1  ORF type:complete len:366 (+),score=77.83 gnl/TRDRNA2_/TRDRNA2_187809_c0_seq1:63-1160(+)
MKCQVLCFWLIFTCGAIDQLTSCTDEISLLRLSRSDDAGKKARQRSADDGDERSADDGDERSADDGDEKSADDGDERSVHDGDEKSAGSDDKAQKGCIDDSKKCRNLLEINGVGKLQGYYEAQKWWEVKPQVPQLKKLMSGDIEEMFEFYLEGINPLLWMVSIPASVLGKPKAKDVFDNEYWWGPDDKGWFPKGSDETILKRHKKRPDMPDEKTYWKAKAWEINYSKCAVHDTMIQIACYEVVNGKACNLAWFANVFLMNHEPTGSVEGLEEMKFVKEKNCKDLGYTVDGKASAVFTGIVQYDEAPDILWTAIKNNFLNYIRYIMWKGSSREANMLSFDDTDEPTDGEEGEADEDDDKGKKDGRR